MPIQTKIRESKPEHSEPPIELVETQNGQDVPPWKYLVARKHAWRKQLEIKGRNITVGQLVASIHANQLSAAEAADNYDLPIEVIEEALQYEKENRSLIDQEFREEKRRLKEKGVPLEPQDLSR